MRVELFINSVSLKSFNAIVLQNGIGAIMAPYQMKDAIVNENEAMDGKEILGTYTKVESRTFSVPIKIGGRNVTEFYLNLDKLIRLLTSSAVIPLRVVEVDDNNFIGNDVIMYVSYRGGAKNYRHYNGRWGEVVFDFEEPNPRNRHNKILGDGDDDVNNGNNDLPNIEGNYIVLNSNALEDYTPLQRGFSDDFSEDFTV